MQKTPWISEFSDQRIAQSLQFSVLGEPPRLSRHGFLRLPDMTEIIVSTSVEEVKKRSARTVRGAKLTLVLAQDEAFNRKMLEQCKSSVLVMNHAAAKQDTLRSLGLPLNDVLARIAAKHKVAIGVELAVLRSLSPGEQARELARIAHVITLCRTAHTTLALLNPYTEEGARAFLRCLGASSQQAHEALVLSCER